MQRASLARVLAAASALAAAALGPACHHEHEFPLRAPLAVDTDLAPVWVPCHPDPSEKEPNRQTCAPEEYISPYIWDQVDNFVFARISRALSFEVSGEAANANSLDEVADSAWYTNRTGEHAVPQDQLARGACKPEDTLPTPDQVADGEWVIDHGKDNGATLGFRVKVPGKGLYLLKADDADLPERASAAAAIGAAIYHALGYYTSCEQVVTLRRTQLKLLPGLTRVNNAGVATPITEEWLSKSLQDTTHTKDGFVRMQASKWLPGVAIGPFRYVGARADDPNDVIEHTARRELRGSGLLAAWLNHWDAREENSMDVWMASDEAHPRSSPGYVRHYIMDTSEIFGGTAGSRAITIRLGYQYAFDLGDILVDFFTLGALRRPWDDLRITKGREKFLYFTADFDPARWKTLYPNPAFSAMTERDAAWMARKLARLHPADVHAFVEAGKFSDPSDTEYITSLLVRRQRLIFARYLTKLSPLTDVRTVPAAGDDEICATDLARFRQVYDDHRFHYTVVQREAHRARWKLAVRAEGNGAVCFTPHREAPFANRAGARVQFDVTNGTPAGPLVIHAIDQGARGLVVVGLTRPEP